MEFTNSYLRSPRDLWSSGDLNMLGLPIGSDVLEDDPLFLSTLSPIDAAAAVDRDFRRLCAQTGRGAPSKPLEAQKRKRSSIACKTCHHRRVRCDAALGGLPCSNCRFREAECVLIDSKRSRCVLFLPSQLQRLRWLITSLL
jgi:hypothetical protein